MLLPFTADTRFTMNGNFIKVETVIVWVYVSCLNQFEFIFLDFPSLLQWFQTAPTKTCPQCRKQVHLQNKHEVYDNWAKCPQRIKNNLKLSVLCQQVSTRHIISKLFFDIGGDEEGTADPESLQVKHYIKVWEEVVITVTLTAGYMWFVITLELFVMIDFYFLFPEWSRSDEGASKLQRCKPVSCCDSFVEWMLCLQLIICLIYLFIYLLRAGLARQTESDGQFKGHRGQAETRPGQYEKRDHG